MTDGYLVDTSALVRLLRSENAKLGWDQPTKQGLLGVCPITELELLVTARSKSDRAVLQAALDTSYIWVLMPGRVYERARELQELLTERSEHRSAGPVDLLVAATAELTKRTLLHYDRDFETVAKASGQPAAWIAEPGSID